jgi:hypothetical protein
MLFNKEFVRKLKAKPRISRKKSHGRMTSTLKKMMINRVMMNNKMLIKRMHKKRRIP